MEREHIIRNLIKEKGMSIKSFSELIGIPYTTLHSMLERGVGKASVDNVIKVCKALGITVDELENMSNSIKNTSIESIAAHAIVDLTEDEQRELINYAKYLKAKREE